jgi:hypothetical protein
MNTLILVLTMGFSAFSQDGGVIRIPSTKGVTDIQTEAMGLALSNGKSAPKTVLKKQPTAPAAAAAGLLTVFTSDGNEDERFSDEDDGNFDCSGNANCQYSSNHTGATGRKLRVAEAIVGDFRGRQERLSGAGVPSSEILHMGYVAVDKGPAVVSVGSSCTKVSGSDRDCMLGVAGTLRSTPPPPAPEKPRPTVDQACPRPNADTLALNSSFASNYKACVEAFNNRREPRVLAGTPKSLSRDQVAEIQRLAETGGFRQPANALLPAGGGTP